MADSRRRLLAALAVTALVCAACSGDDGVDAASGGVGVVTTVDADDLDLGQLAGAPSALEQGADAAGLPEPTVDPEEIISGGPPPDGIPPIDDPQFAPIDQIDFLEDVEPVLVLEIDGDVRVYPVQIMIWHEIVNDSVGGIPVTVSYCPLCNSAITYDRRVGDAVLDFGTSGQLFRSALVMYDRQTESLWSHFTGRAVAGVLTGLELEAIPTQLVSWEDARSTHPGAQVLTRDTGADRPYGDNPYEGYDDVSTPPFLFEGEADPRLAAKAHVIGVQRGADSVAIVADSLDTPGVRHFEVGGESLVAFREAGTASALDAGTVADGFDTGAAAVFSRVLDGEPLSFEVRDGSIVDTATGSTWSVLGEATDGPREGDQLQDAEHLNTFWFAWAAFQPDTRILGSDG